MTLQPPGQLSNFPGCFRGSFCSLPWVLSGGDNLDWSSEASSSFWDTPWSLERSRSLKWIRTPHQDEMKIFGALLSLTCFALLSQRVCSFQLIYTFYKKEKGERHGKKKDRYLALSLISAAAGLFSTLSTLSQLCMQ